MSTAEVLPALERDECDRIARSIVAAGRGGDTTISVRSIAVGNVRWARNQIITSGETLDYQVRVTRAWKGRTGRADCNRVSTDALRDCVARAEWAAERAYPEPESSPIAPQPVYATPTLWSRETAELDMVARSAAIRRLVEPAMRDRLLSAGYLEVGARASYVYDTRGRVAYQRETRTDYSLTARTVDGTGSGWAGMSHFDWKRIDAVALAERAVDSGKRSASPRAVEPGTYVAVLQPQAVADLLKPVLQELDRANAESQRSVFSEPPNGTRLGKSVFDARVTLVQDPMHPDGGFIPFDEGGEPVGRVSWVESGKLVNLGYGRGYAVRTLWESEPLANGFSAVMSGGTASVDDMIASTKRGVLVTRFSGSVVTDRQTLMMTGTTRDGLWLIENGKISHPIKNFRYNESPMFVFNRLETIGTPVRTHGYPPLVVPAIKVYDFAFTHLADAV